MSFYAGTLYEQGASDCFDCIYYALSEKGINTDLTLIGALATCRVEVGRNFLPIAESKLAGIMYEGRKDLGNTTLGDGVKYRGRGYIQLTGRSNYAVYGTKLGIDLINNPDLAMKPSISASILAQYFKDRSVYAACDQKNWVYARKLVNGGTNGLTIFLSIIDQYLTKVVNNNIKVNATNNMQKLEITQIVQEGAITKVSWHRFDSNDVNNDNDMGVWEFENIVTPEAIQALVVAKAKTMVDPGISVSLNLAV